MRTAGALVQAMTLVALAAACDGSSRSIKNHASAHRSAALTAASPLASFVTLVSSLTPWTLGASSMGTDLSGQVVIVSSTSGGFTEVRFDRAGTLLNGVLQAPLGEGAFDPPIALASGASNALVAAVATTPAGGTGIDAAVMFPDGGASAVVTLALKANPTPWPTTSSWPSSTAVSSSSCGWTPATL
jgi:hypothetical protein